MGDFQLGDKVLRALGILRFVNVGPDACSASAADHMAMAKEAVEKNPDAKWRIGVMHQALFGPAFCAFSAETQILLNAVFTPIFDTFDVDLVLTGHSHIQGRSNFVYRVVGTNKFVSLGLKNDYQTQEIHVDVNIVKNDVLDLEAFRQWRPEFRDAEFILEDGKYVCGWAIEKMSKAMFNVVNPDYIVEAYGADTLRMYEMFLGPLEQSKPWDTNGIDGVHKFLRKFWRLFYDREGVFALNDEAATPAELKTLHKTIKKIREDIENFSFNTSVAAFMICVNELGECHKREILEPLTILLNPFAPHITEQLWSMLGHEDSACDASYPVCEEKYLDEDIVPAETELQEPCQGESNHNGRTAKNGCFVCIEVKLLNVVGNEAHVTVPIGLCVVDGEMHLNARIL